MNIRSIFDMEAGKLCDPSIFFLSPCEIEKTRFECDRSFREG